MSNLKPWSSRAQAIFNLCVRKNQEDDVQPVQPLPRGGQTTNESVMNWLESLPSQASSPARSLAESAVGYLSFFNDILTDLPSKNGHSYSISTNQGEAAELTTNDQTEETDSIKSRKRKTSPVVTAALPENKRQKFMDEADIELGKDQRLNEVDREELPEENFDETRTEQTAIEEQLAHGALSAAVTTNDQTEETDSIGSRKRKTSPVVPADLPENKRQKLMDEADIELGKDQKLNEVDRGELPEENFDETRTETAVQEQLAHGAKAAQLITNYEAEETDSGDPKKRKSSPVTIAAIPINKRQKVFEEIKLELDKDDATHDENNSRELTTTPRLDAEIEKMILDKGPAQKRNHDCLNDDVTPDANQEKMYIESSDRKLLPRRLSFKSNTPDANPAFWTYDGRLVVYGDDDESSSRDESNSPEKNARRSVSQSEPMLGIEELTDEGLETPLEDPSTESPIVSNGSRKRPCNPETWKRNIAKHGSNHGIEHLNQKGKLIPARSIGEGCNETCHLKCGEFSQEERKEFFDQFWALGNSTTRWNFLNKYVTSGPPKNPKGATSSRVVRTFTIESKTGEYRVCQKMFLSTLNIYERRIRTSSKRLQLKGATISPDKRGLNYSKENRQKVEKMISSIDQHIRLLKPVPSHLCRKDSRRKYLPTNLSIPKLYIMYLEFMEAVHPGEPVASHRRYHDRFCTAYNFSFFHPKKDQCELCNVFLRGSGELQLKLQAKLKGHTRDKDIARKRKMEDKAAAISDPSIAFCVFDMQKILQCPRDETGVVHYKRYMSVYNETFFDGARKIGHCFVWTEEEGKEGANEVASCAQEYMLMHIQEYGTKDFRYWADNCYGQNKNKFLFCLFTLLCRRLKVKIVIRYLETGHTQNECDSCHKIIEDRCKANMPIFTPDQYYRHIENAKVHGENLKIVQMKGKIIEIHDFCDKFQKWDGKGINWKLVREVAFDPDSPPGTVNVKNSLEKDAPVITINVMKPAVRGRQPNLDTHVFKPAYSKPLQLSAGKLKDLGDLCAGDIIPEEHHDFFKSLSGFKMPVRRTLFGVIIESTEEQEEDEAGEVEVENEREQWMLEGVDDPDPDFAEVS